MTDNKKKKSDSDSRSEYRWSNSAGYAKPEQKRTNTAVVVTVSVVIVVLIGAVIVMGTLLSQVLWGRRADGEQLNMPEDSVAMNIEDPDNVTSDDGASTARIVSSLTQSVVLVQGFSSSGTLINSLQRMGVVVDDGRIVTNSAQEFAAAQSIKVTTYSGGVFTAELVKTDAGADLTLLRVDDEAAELVPITASSRGCALGERVVSVGMYASLPWSVAQGIVSGTARSVTTLINGESFTAEFIQTDITSVDVGSFGVLADCYGDAVGVVFGPLSDVRYTSVCFALPIEYVTSFAASLKK